MPWSFFHLTPPRPARLGPHPYVIDALATMDEDDADAFRQTGEALMDHLQDALDAYTTKHEGLFSLAQVLYALTGLVYIAEQQIDDEDDELDPDDCDA